MPSEDPSDERYRTLGELAARLDDLVHDHGPGMPVAVDHEGVEMDNVQLRVGHDKVVIY